MSEHLDYPDAHPSDHVDHLHGVDVRDPFRHLEQAADPENRRWLAEQNSLTNTHLAALPAQDELHRLLTDVAEGPAVSPVKQRGDRTFRVWRPDLVSNWVLQVCPGDGPWRTVADDGMLGQDAVIRRWQPSPSGRYLAVQVTTGGSESATPLSVIDVDTGEISDTDGRTRYAALAWLPGEDGFYLVRRNAHGPGYGVYRHLIGSAADDDVLVVGDDDPVGRYHLALWHGRWLVITRRQGADRAAELWVQDIGTTTTPQRVAVPGVSVAGVQLDPTGRLLTLSTDGAEFGRLLAARRSAGGHWAEPSELIGERRPSMLSGVTLCNDGQHDRLVVLRTVDGCGYLSIHDAETGAEVREVAMPGHGTVASISATADPGTVAVGYTDWVTPLSVWHLDVRTGRLRRTSAAARIPGIRITRTTVRSHDGVDVPVTLLVRADCAGERPRPTVLSAYGGFGISFQPSYQPDTLAWTLAGGAVAIAGVRGGGERGREWHRAGKGRNKINAVRDLHAVAEWLIADGWARPDQLALLGGSNGGMVAAATFVQHPDHYAAACVGGAPLDMVRYERWGLGKAWREEYGSPTDHDGVTALLAYSPYHNVSDGRSYPAALFAAGTRDTRVDPVHAWKMVARLQYASSGGGPVLLDIVEGMGHVGAGKEAELLTVRLLAFLARHTGLRS